MSSAAEDPIVGDDAPSGENSPLKALLAFDEALAAGADPSAGAGAASSLQAVHECQRLLEAVWPRHIPESPDFPRQFGRFSIVRELGRGAFGVVFLAEDPALRRQVALKVPRAELVALASIRRRFLREAEAASRLDHPNIVPVYEMGEEGPVLYIASAYCQGPTLAEWLRQRTTPVPWGEAARPAMVLAEAVAHAHGRGILHRDLKPGNILLSRGEDTASANGGGGRGPDSVPRICDFGLAKLLDEVSHETSTGLAIGSPPSWPNSARRSICGGPGRWPWLGTRRRPGHRRSRPGAPRLGASLPPDRRGRSGQWRSRPTAAASPQPPTTTPSSSGTWPPVGNGLPSRDTERW